MRDTYQFKDAKITLSKDRNYARIDGGDFVPIKHDGKQPYVVKVLLKDNGCPKGTIKYRLTE